MTWILAIFQSKLARQIGAAFVIVAATLAFYAAKIRQATKKGRSQERDEIDKELRKARDDAHDKVKDVQKDIDNLDGDGLKRVLRDKFRRD